jgi:hypothetical protein
VAPLIVILIIVAGLAGVWHMRKRAGRLPGPGTAGAVYDLLNQDRRNAVEIIVEQRAERRDPEDADGNLPDLEAPKR